MSVRIVFLLLWIMVTACTTIQEDNMSNQRHHMSQRELYQGEVPGTSGTGDTKVRTNWSVSGNLTQTNRDGQVALQASFEQAGQYTVQFFLVPDAQTVNAPAGKPIQCEALITWSAAGNSIKRRVSVIDGMSVSGVAEAVSVVASDLSTLAVVFAPHVTYQVIILVSKGVRAAFSNPPYLVERFQAIPIPPLGLVSANVPQDVGVTSVNVVAAFTASGVGPIADQTITVTQTSNSGTVIKAKYDFRDQQWMPIQPGATQITIENNSAANAAEVQIIFGIDG